MEHGGLSKNADIAAVDGSSGDISSMPSPAAVEIPAIPTAVHFGLSIACTMLYFLLFSIVYVQLFMILCYKHKRFSFQTAFLFLCLLWAALRTTLFSFYLSASHGGDSSTEKSSAAVAAANTIALIPFWILYCFPVCLQFATLSLLVLYFAQVVFSAKAKYEPNNFRYHHHHHHPHLPSTYRDVPKSVRFRRIVRLVIGTAVVTFTVTNITCAVIIRRQEERRGVRPYDVVMTRVLINESLFLICGLSLAVCLFKLNKMTSAKLILETKGTTLCRTMATCVLIVILYLSRAIYNIFVLFFITATPSFNFGWINVADQGNLKGLAYVTFGIVLFIWEFLPTFIVVVFFRVRRPCPPMATSDLISSHSRNSRAHFFDNPRRYDSDEELFKSANSVSQIESPSGRTVEYYVARTSNARYPSPYGSFNHSNGGNGAFRHDSFGPQSSADGGDSASTTSGICPHVGLIVDNPNQPSTSLIYQQPPLCVHARIAGSSVTSGRFFPRDSPKNVAFS